MPPGLNGSKEVVHASSTNGRSIKRSKERVVLRGVPAVRLSSAGKRHTFSAFRQHTRVRLLPALAAGANRKDRRGHGAQPLPARRPPHLAVFFFFFFGDFRAATFLRAGAFLRDFGDFFFGVFFFAAFFGARFAFMVFLAFLPPLPAFLPFSGAGGKARLRQSPRQAASRTAMAELTFPRKWCSTRLEQRDAMWITMGVGILVLAQAGAAPRS